MIGMRVIVFLLLSFLLAFNIINGPTRRLYDAHNGLARFTQVVTGCHYVEISCESQQF